MPRFEPSSGEIVVQIVYDGLATAGKTTNLRQLYEAFPDRARGGVIVPEETLTGRTLYFDWLELKVGHLDDCPLRARVLSVPGQFAYARRRFRLLREIDGVVLVCDSSERGVAAGKIAFTFLQKVIGSSPSPREIPIVLQANKQDAVDAMAPDEVARRLEFIPDAVVGARADQGEGVRATLLRTLDLVRARVRKRLAGAPPSSLPRENETAEGLYRTLLAENDELESDDLADALDAALEQVRP